MRYSFSFDHIDQLRSSWDFIDDDANNKIYNILVDHMVKGEVSIYVVYNDCTIKKFTAKIKGADLNFEEYPHIYNVQSHFCNDDQP